MLSCERTGLAGGGGGGGGVVGGGDAGEGGGGIGDGVGGEAGGGESGARGAGEKKTEAEPSSGAPATIVLPSIATENPSRLHAAPSGSIRREV